jgi:hypothetical protein
MSGRQASVVAILAVILAACTAGVEATPSSPVSPGPSHGPSSLATVSPAPTAVVATPAPVATVTPAGTATPVPVPPKPTGVKFRASQECLGKSCQRYKYSQTVTWKAPRTKGVEIRVYGVTECIAEPVHPKPGTDGPCLVKNTPLPESVRTLLATAPASAGRASWSWIAEEPGCEIWYPVGDPPGHSYYAVVVAAYSTSGHSIFTIAEPGGWREWDWESGDTIC